MPSEVKLAIDCFENNLDFGFQMMCEATNDVNSIVGHMHNGRAYLCHQEKDEHNKATND